MKLINSIAFAAALLNLAVPGSGEPNTNTSVSPVIIEVVGGSGHLTSLELQADGTFLWHGWEPGRKVASVRKSKLEAEELKAIVGLADLVWERRSESEFAGGEASSTLVLRRANGQQREITLHHAKHDERPGEIKELLHALWATRNREEMRLAPVGPANGSEPIRSFTNRTSTAAGPRR